MAHFLRGLLLRIQEALRVPRTRRFLGLVAFFVLVPFVVRRRRRRIPAAAAAKTAGAVVAAASSGATEQVVKALPFSEFLRKVVDGQVREALLAPGAVSFTLKGDDTAAFVTRPVTVHPGLVDILHSHNVQFDQAAPSKLTGLQPMFVLAVPFVYLALCAALLYKYYDPTGGGSDVGALDDDSAPPSATGERAGTTFDDVEGIDEAKAIVREVSEFLRNPQRFTQVGARLPTGIMLVGPPGTGKTMLARAIAHDAGCSFFYCSGSDFVEIFAGRGAQRVRKLFEKAHKAAPAVVFFDEIDALGKRRGAHELSMNEEREQTLNQLLAAMDGFKSDKRIVVMAATNRFDVLDSALVRPGRFDRIVRVPLPNAEGRARILGVHTRAMQLDDSVDMAELGRMTPNFTGAELAMLANEAAIHAAREERQVLCMNDFLAALHEFFQARGMRGGGAHGSVGAGAGGSGASRRDFSLANLLSEFTDARPSPHEEDVD